MSPARGLHLAFAGMGATASSLPALLPTARSLFGEAALTAAPLLFLGLLVGVGMSAIVGARASAARVVATGALIQGAGLILAALSWSAAPFLAAAAVAGLGFGLAESALGVVAKSVARSIPGSSTARTITGLTTTLAVVACASPLVIAGFALLVPDTLVLLVAPAALNLAAAAAVASLGTSERAPDHRHGDARGPRRGRAASASLVTLAGALFVYVGVESAVSGWSAAITADLLRVDAAWSAIGTSAFWALMALGRGGGGVLLRRGATPRIVLAAGAAVAAVALLAAALAADAAGASSGVLALAAIGVAVIAFAPTYGLILASAIDAAETRAAQRVAAVVVAAGAGGGALIPLALVAAGSAPGAASTFALLGAGSILVLILILVRPGRSAPTQA